MKIKRVLVSLFLAMGICSFLFSNMLAAKQEDSFEVLLDQAPIQESYEQFPQVHIQVDSGTQVEDLRILLVCGEEESLLEGQWKTNEEDSWSWDTMIAKEGSFMRLQIWRADTMLYESEAFSIHLPTPKVQFSVDGQPLREEMQVYDHAIELQVHFPTQMNIEKTNFYHQNEKVELLWNENKDQARISLSKQGMYCLQYELESSQGVTAKGEMSTTLLLDFDKPQVQVFANGKALHTADRFDQEVVLRFEVMEQNLDVENSKIMINDQPISVQWTKEKDKYVSEIAWQDGTYKLSYTIVDLAKHQAAADYHDILLDTQKPKVQLKAFSKPIDQKLQVEIQMEDCNLNRKESYLMIEHNGVLRKLYPDWQQRDNRYFYMLEAEQEGDYQITAYAQDELAHQSSDTLSLHVDRTPPKLMLYYQNKPLKQILRSNHTLHLQPHIEDEHLRFAQLYIRKNNQIPQKLGMQTIELKAEKNQNNDYELILFAEDEAGNYSEQHFAIAIHTAMPDIVIVKDAFQQGALSTWTPEILYEGENYRVIHAALYRNHKRVDYHWREPICLPGSYQLELVVEDMFHNQRRLQKPFAFTLVSADDQVELAIGDSYTIPYMELSDMVVRVNGVKVSNPRSYRFQPKKEGTYHIEIEGINKEGKKVHKQVEIQAKSQAAKQEKYQGVWWWSILIVGMLLILGVGYVIRRKNRSILPRG